MAVQENLWLKNGEARQTLCFLGTENLFLFFACDKKKG